MRAKALWAKLPDVDVIQEHLEMFWRFVAERQEIWYRRFVQQKPPPWTNDPILRDYKFTNVYRELDHGTIWYMKKVAKFAKKAARDSSGHLEKEVWRMNLLWCTILYRLVNRVETFEEVGFLSYFEWNTRWRSWKDKLEKRRRRGDQVFTSAHLTLPTHKIGQTKIDRYMEVLHDLHDHKLSDLYDEIKNAESLEEVFEALLKVECVGRFIAYEVCCDLMLVEMIPFSENDWVNPGPGCKHGINLICPKVRTVKHYQTCIKALCLHQKSHFEDYGLIFHEYRHPLTLRGIEHSLCEFQKYYKMKHNAGKRREHFKPRDWGQKILKFKPGPMSEYETSP